jgi:multiple sugar transport system substrate-binding protein
MKRTISVLFIIYLSLSMILTGCGKESPLDPNNPVTLTLWHNYGGIMQAAMDQLVEKFNDTEGKNFGIIINVESINSFTVLQEKLMAAANEDPGAPHLPDITTCYPKIAIILAKKELLADLDNYFTKEELSAYVPSFVEEGRIDGTLYVFPIAKSTEVLFVNRTLFDRFAADTGVSTDSLSTFEGLLNTAKVYYEWTDTLTPDIEDDGKSFYMSDSFFNLMQVGMEQLGDTFVKNESLNTRSKSYQYIYNLFHEAAEEGYLAVYNGYSSDLQKTGDIITSTGSTAGILYYGYSVTYSDNTTEAVEYSILPYPVFEGSKKVAIQRGNGMIVTASSEQKEYAAALFLKWFTKMEHNMQFISQTGYLPVTNGAFEAVMNRNYTPPADENIRKLLDTAVQMHKEYNFYIPPVFDDFDSMGKTWQGEFYNSISSE